mmetsp:Transcript_1816/g.3352  ORF Transcript_1816/g.3352 Transcript_1816/m.3352 type:complete len:107 (+) Transcript_1816:286-606(+)
MNELGTLGDVTVTTRLEKFKQTEHYDSYLPVLREEHMCDWALVVDIDEYLYAKPPTSNLAEFFALVPLTLRKLSCRGQCSVRAASRCSRRASDAASLGGGASRGRL